MVNWLTAELVPERHVELLYHLSLEERFQCVPRADHGGQNVQKRDGLKLISNLGT